MLAAALGALLNLERIASAGLRLFRVASRLARLEESRPVRFLLGKGQEVSGAFQPIASRAHLALVFGLSMAVWMCTYLTCYWILLSFREVDASSLPFGLSVVGSTALHATCILPVNALGNLGTFEAAWAAGYIFIGMEEKLAVTTGIAVHAITFTYLLALGILGWIGLLGFKPAAAEAKEEPRKEPAGRPS